MTQAYLDTSQLDIRYNKFVKCNPIRNKFADHSLKTHVAVCHKCSTTECTPEVMVS